MGVRDKLLSERQWDENLEGRHPHRQPAKQNTISHQSEALRDKMPAYLEYAKHQHAGEGPKEARPRKWVVPKLLGRLNSLAGQQHAGTARERTRQW